VIIPPRFNGPPDSANGGYTAGMLAGYLNSPTGAEVTLRRPPPLAAPLDVRTVSNGIEVHDGDRLVASAVPLGSPPTDAVPPVAWDEAMALSESYAGFTTHPFPTCYVCGPHRPPGDGLRLFPGRLPDGRTAAPWVVPEDVEPAVVWAALDCPGGWSIAPESRPYVLGRIAARVDGVPVAGDGCVVMGATVSMAGRKADVLSTVYGPQGTVLARARAVWIALPNA
jgi:hypothetical protein